jgi:pilus assembly protein CpaB
MQMRALIMLVVALVLGAIAVVLVKTVLEQKVAERGEMKALATRPVVVAAVDLDVGTRLDRLMLKRVDWPADSIPEGTFSEIDPLVGDKGRVVIKEIHKGEPLMTYKVSPPGARGGLTARIPNDMRAMTIAVNEVRGVAGFVLPGDRVDVLLTTTGRAGAGSATRTLLQNILVLGVDQQSSEKEDTPKVVNAVTMLVTPDEGKKLTLAQSIGELSLLLRSERDTAMAPPSEVTLADLRFAPPAPEPAAPKAAAASTRSRPTGVTVEVIRGLRVGRQTVSH